MTVRRSQADADGNESWVLISQIEHARISGELAEAWHRDAFASPAAREELVAAATHHDDGWAEWELRPGVDPATGRPRAFTEMVLDDSLSIWRKSIDACAPIGPLAARTVAGHFSYLLRHSYVWEHRPTALGPASPGPITDAADERKATDWLEEFDDRRQEWLAAWQRQDPDRHTESAANDASILLALWDRMSLWLCCTQPTEPYEIETPHEPLTMTPLAAEQVELTPWPLSVDVYRPTVTAPAVPVKQYASGDKLAEVEHREVTLRWEVRPKRA